MNMNTTILKKTAALAVLCALSAPALAADTFDVKVAGKITPPSCTPSLGNGGVFDYGNIEPNTLSPSASTNLEQKSTPFTITCKSATKVAVVAVDNRAGTNPNTSPTMTFNGSSSSYYANAYGLGLGTDGGGNKIGGYALVLSKTVTLDGRAASILYTGGSAGRGWLRYSSGAMSLSFGPTFGLPYSSSWATGTGNTPTAFKVMNTTLMMQAYITKTSGLDMTKPVNLDGNATIELTYL